MDFRKKSLNSSQGKGFDTLLIVDKRESKDKIARSLVDQLAAWAFESHAWQVIDDSKQIECLWCGQQREMPDKWFADDLCPANPFVKRLLTPAGLIKDASGANSE